MLTDRLMVYMLKAARINNTEPRTTEVVEEQFLTLTTLLNKPTGQLPTGPTGWCTWHLLTHAWVEVLTQTDVRFKPRRNSVALPIPVILWTVELAHALPVGLEPTTHGLTVRCSAN